MAHRPSSSAGAAVPIVKPGANGSYELDEQALGDILNNEEIADKKVAVISVAGAYRKGKSYLLNYLVHYLYFLKGNKSNNNTNNNNNAKGEWFNSETVLDKFHWQAGSECDTHGILMWNESFILKDQNGEEIVVLLMDTQGTFDSESDLQQCTTIFALSAMLSSFQIFNVSQNIQEDDLQNLQLFTEFAKLAKKTDETTAPFQSLMFLVRDWQNSDEYAYGYEGGEKFLTKKLKVKQSLTRRLSASVRRISGQGESWNPKENQEVRTNLRSSFSELSCFLMPHPGLKVSNNNKQKKVGELEAEFKKAMMSFAPSLFADVQAKQLNGHDIDCFQLCQLFKTYFAVFEGETLPSPKSVYQATIDATNLGALEKSKRVYEKAVAKADDGETTAVEFEKLHTQFKKKAIQAFNGAPKMGADTVSKPYMQKLEKFIEQSYANRSKIIQEREELARKKREQEERERIEKERLRKIAEEQAREKERLRKQREEEERRAAEERRRLEEQARRQREDAERQRLAREAEQRRIDQERRELEAEKRRQREEAEQERREMAEARRYASQMSYSYAPSFGYSSPSFSGASSSNSGAYWDPSGGRGHTGRWRDTNGRFCKNPYG